MISRIPRVLQMLWPGSVLSTSDIPVQLWPIAPAEVLVGCRCSGCGQPGHDSQADHGREPAFLGASCWPDIGPAARCPSALLSGTGQSAFLVVDRGEQRGVGADQRGALQWEQRAVGSAALSDPLVGQIHRLHSVRGGWPDHRRGLAE